MTIRRFVSIFAIASALVVGSSVVGSSVVGCSSPGPNRMVRASTAPSPTTGADTGALASDTTRPSSAWPVARQNEPARPREDTIHVHSDGVISRRVGNAIISQENLSGSRNVVVTTHQGVVTIRGNVASDRDRVLIQDAVRAVPGVTRVENELEVSE